jgi:hypothetical protein
MMNRWFNRPNRAATPQRRHTAEPLEPRRLLTSYSLVERAALTSMGTGIYDGAVRLPPDLSVDSVGNVFGISQAGGDSGHGSIWELPQHATTISILAPFDADLGGEGLVEATNGDLFCVGGLTVPVYFDQIVNGVIYRLPYGGHSLSTYYQFPDGQLPVSGLTLDAENNLYFVTETSSGQTICELPAGSDSRRDLAPMPAGVYQLNSNLVLDSSGDVYGLALIASTIVPSYEIFELANGATAITALATTAPSQTKIGPALIRDPAGDFFGVVSDASDNASIYEVPVGKNSFAPIASDSHLPLATALALDPEGNLFGANAYGSYGLPGTDYFFELPVGSDELVSLASFIVPDHPNGFAPGFLAGVVSDSSGNLFAVSGVINELQTVVELSPNLPLHLSVIQQPNSGPEHLPLKPLILNVEDDEGDLVINDSSTVILSVGSGPAGAELEGNVSVSAILGVVTFGPNWLDAISLSLPGTYVLQATAGDAQAAVFAPITVSPTGLKFVNQPTNGVLGEKLALIVVSVEDTNGNILDDPSKITLGIASGPAGAVLGGTTTGQDFYDLSLSVAGTYTLSATDEDRTPAVSSSFTIVDPNVPTVTLTASMNSAPPGANVTFKATLTPFDDYGTPTGSVTFFDDAVPLESVRVSALAESGGFPQSDVATASLTVNTLTPGKHAITAHYEGDSKYKPAVAPPIAETIIDTAIVPNIVRTLLPASVVATASQPGTVLIRVTNRTSIVQSLTKLEVYAATNGALDQFATLIGSVRYGIILPPERAAVVPVRVNTSNVSPGDYKLVAMLSGPYDSSGISPGGPALHVDVGTVELSASVLKSTLALSTLGDSPTPALAVVRILNSGNLVSRGWTSVAIQASADGESVDGFFNEVQHPMVISPGAMGVVVVVPLRRIPDLNEGDYHLVASVNDGTASGATGPVVHIAKGFVQLDVSTQAIMLPASGTDGQRTRAAAKVSITNSGNVLSSDYDTINLYASRSPDYQMGDRLINGTRSSLITFAPKQTRAFIVPLVKFPKAPDGSYFLTARVDAADGPHDLSPITFPGSGAASFQLSGALTISIQPSFLYQSPFERDELDFQIINIGAVPIDGVFNYQISFNEIGYAETGTTSVIFADPGASAFIPITITDKYLADGIRGQHFNTYVNFDYEFGNIQGGALRFELNLFPPQTS